MEYILKTNDLVKRYGRYEALNGLTMNVPKGSIYGLVGKNGAGKTTLIRLICGLQNPTSGEYSIYGVSNKQKEIIQSRHRMGAVVETPAIYLDMTAEDNLKVQHCVLGLPSFDEIPHILKMVGLENTGKKKARNFSLGMRQRLGIAVAIVGSPDFLVLDEPTNGLDPQGIVEMREIILKLNRQHGITILISSHILDEMARLATHFGFIDNGQMIEEISASELNAACRKCIHVSVSNIKALSKMLDDIGLEYTIFPNNEADIFGELNVTELVLKLSAENCDVKSLYERDESLENYYINLLGGISND
ncbi:MAG: ABC transporter ATP-binding protein [Lacrimispora saccharolytica]